MSQFFVYANADAASRRSIPYWLNVQSDLVEVADSRVVVPLIALQQAGPLIRGLMPILQIAGKRLVMDTAQITNVPIQILGRKEADVSADRSTIIDALDFLTHGV
jgi:toxin CcdB